MAHSGTRLESVRRGGRGNKVETVIAPGGTADALEAFGCVVHDLAGRELRRFWTGAVCVTVDREGLSLEGRGIFGHDLRRWHLERRRGGFD